MRADAPSVENAGFLGGPCFHRDQFSLNSFPGGAMQKLSLIGVTIVAMMASAWAADMPVKSPAAVAQPAAARGWTGCYLGAHIGGGWGGRELSSPTGFPWSDSGGISGPLFTGTGLSIDQWASGLLGGGQA